MSAILVYKGADLRLVDMNDQAREDLRAADLDADAMIGLAADDILVGDRLGNGAWIIEVMRRVMETRRPVATFYRGQRYSGKLSFIPIFDGDEVNAVACHLEHQDTQPPRLAPSRSAPSHSRSGQAADR